ncbi:hypothetical protein GXW83_21645 [Streptacidiphilus sp. PB12-B1b]|uniref:hypothetical protein n=1 Tax=Streptacidiphilus sp. PB12-B1b TaxID=2705012 RepID=UPI0015F98141|nr:hypothetical protein [Streptacidiphilus sp. PB12-B1b]QMU77909.1 hypothetical protein GXW83_21645 [Streptacidiphilus sp. PB12-B1b]
MSHEDEARQPAPADGGTVHLRRPPQDAVPQEVVLQEAPPQDARPGAGVGTVRLGKQGAAAVDPRSSTALPPTGPARRPEAAQRDQGTVQLGPNPTLAFPTVALPAEQPTLREPEPEPEPDTAPVPVADLTGPAVAAGAAGVLRFGPGVPDPGTAHTIAVWQGTAPGPQAPPPAAPGRRRWVRLLPVLLVLLAVAGYLLWQRVGPPLSVASVSVTATPAALSCGGTEQLTATVRTNGRRGTLRYHWVRSDGTDSGPLTASLSTGDRQVQLPLRWTVQGHGDFHGTATLDITAPGGATASAAFSYACH